MITKIDNFRNVFESASKKHINENKLIEAAKSIEFLCNGEYGYTYWHKENNHIFICLGDSNPFDDSYLEWYMKDIVCDDYSSQDHVKVEIDNECSPKKDETGWYKFNGKKFVERK